MLPTKMNVLSLTRKMADPWLDTIEQRLGVLEKQIFGESDKDADYPKVIDTLANLNNQVTQAVKGRTKIENAFNRLSELEQYLDPAYTDQLSLSKAAKTEIILADEEILRQKAANLETVEEMMPVLNSEHIKVVPSLQGQLQALSKVHIKQQDSASELTEDIKNMLLYYNSVITLLSKQFVQWDEIVTHLESAAQIKKLDD